MTKKDCFYGIYPIRFIWHGEWSDPEIEYKKHRFNYWDIENFFHEEWLFEHKENAPDFDKWLSSNGARVKEHLNYIIELEDKQWSY